MPVVPLFHANGWSLAYSTPLNGAAMVMPGRDMTPAGIYEMLEKTIKIPRTVEGSSDSDDSEDDDDLYVDQLELQQPDKRGFRPPPKFLFKRQPHMTWDNYFSGGAIMEKLKVSER